VTGISHDSATLQQPQAAGFARAALAEPAVAHLAEPLGHLFPLLVVFHARSVVLDGTEDFLHEGSPETTQDAQQPGHLGRPFERGALAVLAALTRADVRDGHARHAEPVRHGL
jgi:hypothetical protein